MAYYEYLSSTSEKSQWNWASHYRILLQLCTLHRRLSLLSTVDYVSEPLDLFVALTYWTNTNILRKSVRKRDATEEGRHMRMQRSRCSNLMLSLSRDERKWSYNVLAFNIMHMITQKTSHKYAKTYFNVKTCIIKLPTTRLGIKVKKEGGRSNVL